MHTVRGKYLSKPTALKYSSIAVLSAFLVEVSMGLFVGSLAILSDGLHALFDALSTIVLLISAYLSLKPPDEEHTYGHEKFEALGGLIGSFILVALAMLIAVEAVLRTIGGEPYINPSLGLMGFIALGYTLSIDVLRMVIFSLTSKRESPLIRAGLYHALSDLSSTLIALFGFWLAISYGVFYGDSIASLALSVILIILSARLAWDSIMELSDVAPRGVLMRIREEIYSISGGLFSYEGLRVRKAGDKFFVRATLRVPDYMSLSEAHEISSKIKDKIVEILGEADVSFHIEPMGMKGMATEKFIERIAGGFKGVVGVHDVHVRCSDGKIYITLHVQVDPSTPLSEAHKLTERIEGAISKSINNVGNVLVHVEPSNIELRSGRIMDEKEIYGVAHLAAKKYGGDLRVKRVITYNVDGRRHIGVECSFGREISVEEAHKIASEIEELIREKISEAVVTVHMEPEEGGGS